VSERDEGQTEHKSLSDKATTLKDGSRIYLMLSRKWQEE
jgi:hypothetical protein